MDRLCEMWPQRAAPSAGRYLSPSQVVSRLQSEFAYVETSGEHAQRYILEVIQQLQDIGRSANAAVDEKYLRRLEQGYHGAVWVQFGDDVAPETALISTHVVPGEPLLFECISSQPHRVAEMLSRCVSVLNYELLQDRP